MKFLSFFRIAELKILADSNQIGRELLEEMERELAKRGIGVLWKNLTQDDKNTIEKLWTKGDLSPDVYPFYEETVFEPNSLGLRYKGKIVGWSLAESKAPQSLWYSKLYLDPAFRISGIAIQLLAASILRNDHVRFPNVYFKLN